MKCFEGVLKKTCTEMSLAVLFINGPDQETVQMPLSTGVDNKL